MGCTVPANQHRLLLVCAAWCLVACVQSSHPSAEDAPCPPEYPTARLLNSCPPAPAWCRRLRGHGARRWPRCRPRCGAYLDFGERRYPVAWSSPKTAKLPVFGLALPGWRKLTVTIWGQKVYARRNNKGAWQIVYPVDGRLVAVAMTAKPPYDCDKRRSAGGRKRLDGGSRPTMRRRLRGLRARCYGNMCTVRLQLRRLMKAAAKLRRRGSGRQTVALRLTLASGVGPARFTGGELLLLHVGTATRRRQPKREEAEEEDSASGYRKFLAGQRKNYWRKKGWREDLRKKRHPHSRHRKPRWNARGAEKKKMSGPTKPVRIGGEAKSRHPAKEEAEALEGGADKHELDGLLKPGAD